MNKDDEFYRDMQRYVAVTTVGPSTLRNQVWCQGLVGLVSDWSGVRLAKLAQVCCLAQHSSCTS